MSQLNNTNDFEFRVAKVVCKVLAGLLFLVLIGYFCYRHYQASNEQSAWEHSVGGYLGRGPASDFKPPPPAPKPTPDELRAIGRTPEQAEYYKHLNDK